jgi:hypothetical protein
MSNLLQTVIPAAATFLVGYQGALTRTSRLRKSIRADMDLLGALPDGHPNRATLTTHVEELIDTLVRRPAVRTHHPCGDILRRPCRPDRGDGAGRPHPGDGGDRPLPPGPAESSVRVAGAGLLRGPDAYLRRPGVPGLAASAFEVILGA